LAKAPGKELALLAFGFSLTAENPNEPGL